MHADSLDSWRHEHVFLGEHHSRNERRSWAVVALCGTMMAAEIAGGILWGSMALVADGLHMSTHAGALVIAAFAYAYARRHARDARFAFGTGKLGDLAAFASAIVLAMIALLIGYESVERLVHPVQIAFGEAIPLAALGLGVNLISAWLLHDDEHDGSSAHAHAHHDGDHHHHHADHNLRAAYVHVVADAAVSVLALVGLVTARALGWLWMDPAMGLVGMVVIANWSWNLIRVAGSVLLDMQPAGGLGRQIEQRLEAAGGDRIADLHLWRVGPGHHAAVVSIVSDRPETPAAYKARLAGIPGLSHVTVEVLACPGVH
ncbi:MAG TPA: CDF family Co(II)/Ni(II) efflux transporter DmeF [Stellaceae bacterium]|jgi:cation diffusion facilitator family transporter|nr:CDF family Co(II)/Ni(II) efflux transporter DmeF [Stellaceae bacterium]